MSKKTALITGGSSGIGFELSKLFAKDGYNLVIVSLPQDELDRAKNYFDSNYDIETVILQKNLAVQGSAKEVHDFTKEKDITIDVLVNCAGFGSFGKFNEISIDKELNMINLDLVTLYHLTRLYVDDMVERDSGYILNVASMAAFQPIPYCAMYSSVKASVLYYTRAINFELRDRGSKVSATALCPPSTKTGFAKAADMENSSMFQDEKKVATPDEVAKEAYQALFDRKPVIVPGKGVYTGVSLMNRVFTVEKVMKMMKKQL